LALIPQVPVNLSANNGVMTTIIVDLRPSEDSDGQTKNDIPSNTHGKIEVER